MTDTKPRKLHLFIGCCKLASLVLALSLALCMRERNLDRNETQQKIARFIESKELLVNYNEYCERHAEDSQLDILLTEDLLRKLVFNYDIMQVGRHNLAYVTHKQNYSIRQLLFAIDISLGEMVKLIGRLKHFEANATNSTFGLDRPVSGVPELVLHSGVELERDNKLSRWFKRKMNGDSYFKIPNFPLDQQPDPQRVTHIDADHSDCIKDIDNQKGCGACYAFSWNSFAEWHYCKQTGKIINFSEQHIIDCGHRARLSGCQDGYLKYTRGFTHFFGFHLEEKYPYKGKQGTCKDDKVEGPIQVKIKHFPRIEVDRRQWEEVLKEQPILVQAKLPIDILSYSRGIHPGLNCVEFIAHGMLLVGYGSQEGVPYWLLRNSMGKSWGENGYLRLSREAPLENCFHRGFIGKFRFKSLDEETYNNFYESIKFNPTEDTTPDELDLHGIDI